MDLTIEHLQRPVLAELHAIENQLKGQPEPELYLEDLFNLVNLIRRSERRDALRTVFSRLEKCSTDGDALEVVEDFVACGILFEEILPGLWYQRNKGDEANQVDDSNAHNAARAKLLRTMSPVVPEPNTRAIIKFDQFNSSVCGGTTWEECIGMFDTDTLLNELVGLIGGAEAYTSRGTTFTQYAQLAIGYKYVYNPEQELSAPSTCNLVQAQMRLVSAPVRDTVEKWDADCLLFGTVNTVVGPLTISGYPDLVCGSFTLDDPVLNRNRELLHDVQARSLNGAKLADAVAAKLRSAHQALVNAQRMLQPRYLRYAKFPIVVKPPSLQHAVAGANEPQSHMNWDSIHELCGQLLVLQPERGGRPAVCGLLTDGFSGTIVLLRGKYEVPNSPHKFVYLPFADSVRTLYHYVMLITLLPAMRLEELMVQQLEAKKPAEATTSTTAAAVAEQPLSSPTSSINDQHRSPCGSSSQGGHISGQRSHISSAGGNANVGASKIAAPASGQQGTVGAKRPFSDVDVSVTHPHVDGRCAEAVSNVSADLDAVEGGDDGSDEGGSDECGDGAEYGDGAAHGLSAGNNFHGYGAGASFGGAMEPAHRNPRLVS